jgi:16S rRNA (uracil1498-N3)-methyltransferase
VLEATGPVEEEPAARPAIVVAFSLPKQDRADWAVRMLTELGVDEIVPLLCERTVVRPEGEGGLRRHERLERISREAAMQSRRVRLPVLRRPEAIATMIGRAAHSLSLAEPGGGSLSLERPGVLVGPEGGWSDGELAAARNAAVPQVALPGGVLRVETAAVAAGAVLAWLRQSGSPAAGRAAVSQG